MPRTYAVFVCNQLNGRQCWSDTQNDSFGLQIQPAIADCRARADRRLLYTKFRAYPDQSDPAHRGTRLLPSRFADH